MSNDDARRAILLRRARFITAALATAGIATSCGDSGDSSTPQPCLKLTSDAGLDGDASGGAAGEPQVCLSPALGGTGGGSTDDSGTD